MPNSYSSAIKNRLHNLHSRARTRSRVRHTTKRAGYTAGGRPGLVALCAVSCVILPVWGRAQAQKDAPSPLPVRQVTLFTSGVAYTERAGTVDGTAEVPLMFRVAQINDILKSLVLLDRGGQVQPATYTARDPISHTLQGFAVDVTSNMTQIEILSRLRGASVQIETPGKPTLTGQIAGVEQRQIGGDDGKPILAPFLNLLGDNGLATVRLDGDKTVRLLDERLNREFRAALGLLASGADTQRRQVTLHFAGQGKRDVRVGYVMEAPLWKMSYRLLLGASTPSAAIGGKPYLQGWALVENTSDDDWQNIRLSLVSGRPVSFIEDLYQPLYLPRPVVAPDIVASPYPQTHEGDLQNAPAPIVPGAAGGFGGGGGRGEAMGRSRAKSDSPAALGAAGPSGTNAPTGVNPSDIFAMDADNSLVSRYGEDARKSVIAQASGARAGELFQYSIATPVTLPRQQAAMIPVIAQDIEAEKLLLFNADSGTRFPLNAVRLHNATRLHLKGGPVTLFDGGVYAGDARMEDVAPGDSRLLSYAVDTSVEGERQGPANSTIETTFSLKRGVLNATRRERTETTYTLKSHADTPRVILVEHPFQAQYKLIAPAAATERTAGVYRFAVPVAPGKSQTLKVVVERPISQTFGILDGDLTTLTAYTSRGDISAKLKAALTEVVKRRASAQSLREQAQSRDEEVKSIGNDQERIRKNMAALDKASALYRRYVGELDTQETRLEHLRQEATRLRAQADAADTDLRAYIDSLAPLE